MKIGLVPMSAKPYHAGHDGLVRIASKECDKVLLFVSTTDRARTGELRVSGDTMQLIWFEYIEPTLPSNVVPDYGGIPVSKVYDELKKAEAQTLPVPSTRLTFCWAALTIAKLQT